MNFKKECRPMWLPWSLAIAGFAISNIRLGSAASLSYGGGDPGVAGLFLGIVGMNAFASVPFGSELQQGTLPFLLAQPVGRRALWFRKTFLIGLFHLPILLLIFARASWSLWTFQILLVCSAIGLTPWFALLFRNTVAAISLGIIVPFFARAFLEARIERWISIIFPQIGFPGDRGTLALALLLTVIGFIGSYRCFVRFQTASRWQSDIGSYLPTPAPNSMRPRKTSMYPIVALARKELRLQRLPVALFILLVLSLLLFSAKGPANLHSRVTEEYFLGAFTGTFSICLLAGCMAVVEEKRLGTLAWTQSSPILPARHWSIKAFTGLALSLGFMVTTLGVVWTQDPSRFTNLMDPILGIVVALALFSIGLLASALTTGILEAFFLGMLFCVLWPIAINVLWHIIWGYGKTGILYTFGGVTVVTLVLSRKVFINGGMSWKLLLQRLTP